MTNGLPLKIFFVFDKEGYLKLPFICHHHFKRERDDFNTMKNKETISEFKILIKLAHLNKFSCFFLPVSQ